MHSIKRAIQLVDEGNIEEAIQLLNKYAETATDDEILHVIELYYEWGFFDEAISLLETLLSTYPGESELIILLAEMYIEIEQDERAIDLLNEIEKDDPTYLQVLIHLADLYQAQGLFEVSEQKLMEAKKISPNEIVIDFALGELFFSIAQYNRAITFFEKVAKKQSDFHHVSVTERLAECYALIGNYEQSLLFYDDLNSEDPNTLFKYGFTAVQIGRNDIAINVWKKLIALDPHYHSAYYELAKALKEELIYEEAKEIAQKGLLYDEYNKELYLLASQISLQLKEVNQALTYVEKALSLDNDYKEAVLLYIQLLKENHDYETIIQFLLSIKEDGATDPIYDWELAKAYNEQENYDQAYNSYVDASIDLMHDSSFLKEYGYFLFEDGNLSEAIEIMTKYLQIEPLDEEIMTFLKRLQFSQDE